MKLELALLTNKVRQADLWGHSGTVTDLHGPILHAAFEGLVLGEICAVDTNHGTPLLAEVIGIDQTTALLSPFGAGTGVFVGARVSRQDTALKIDLGDWLLGRVVDGLGVPTDGPPGEATVRRRVAGETQNPLDRPLITTPLTTGLRAIDAITTLGRGQRISVIGPPGTGKSSLLAAIAANTEADAVVLGLIGERGREVREFVERQLPADKRKNVVVVAVTSDRPAMERVHGASTATTIAEYFRDQGKTVLLMVDSLTRVARALREVGLAAGEAPTRRGYPASVYPALPKLIERAGCTENGDITALYTVLAEGDGQNDPIAEEARSLTDGHITLSQTLADKGHYPAIDILQSLSRVMNDVVEPAHVETAQYARRMLAKYAEIEVLLQVGEYREGFDEDADRAVKHSPIINTFLRQNGGTQQTLNQTVGTLLQALQ